MSVEAKTSLVYSLVRVAPVQLPRSREFRRGRAWALREAAQLVQNALDETPSIPERARRQLAAAAALFRHASKVETDTAESPT